MATFVATLLDRLPLTRGLDQASRQADPRNDDPFRLRPVASEEVFFFTKGFDNSKVIRQADPREGRSQAWMIGGSMAGAVALVAVMLPTLGGAVAGYKIEALRQEKNRLLNEQTTLDLAETKLMSSQHLEELARKQGMVDPDPTKIVYLDSRQDSTVARSVVPASKEQLR